MASSIPEQDYLDELMDLEDEGIISTKQELDLENVLSVLGDDHGNLSVLAVSAMDSAIRAAINKYEEN